MFFTKSNICFVAVLSAILLASVSGRPLREELTSSTGLLPGRQLKMGRKLRGYSLSFHYTPRWSNAIKKVVKKTATKVSKIKHKKRNLTPWGRVLSVRHLNHATKEMKKRDRIHKREAIQSAKNLEKLVLEAFDKIWSTNALQESYPNDEQSAKAFGESQHEPEIQVLASG